jgi:uncharacterized integral membrane protein
MKKATMIIWVIIFAFIALVIFQNKPFFLGNKEALHLNLGVLEAYHSPELPMAIIVLIFFFAGLAVAYLFGLSSRFKAKRTIKRLNATITDHSNELTKLRSEINMLKGIDEPAVDNQADTVKINMDKTQKISGEGAGNNTEGYALDNKVANPGEESIPNEDTEKKAEEKIQ